MARRAISENHVQELEYRLLALLRQTKAYGPTEVKTRYAAIVGLASLWGIDLDKYRSLANLGLRGQLIQPGLKDKPEEPSQPAPDTLVETGEKPLTEPLTGDIFGELEGDSE